MTLDSTQDLFFLVLAIATGWVAVFVCWSLAEVARLLHQTNAVVSDAREKLNRLERIVMMVKEMAMEGGRVVAGMMGDRKRKK